MNKYIPNILNLNILQYDDSKPRKEGNYITYHELEPYIINGSEFKCIYEHHGIFYGCTSGYITYKQNGETYYFDWETDWERYPNERRGNMSLYEIWFTIPKILKYNECGRI